MSRHRRSFLSRQEHRGRRALSVDTAQKRRLQLGQFANRRASKAPVRMYIEQHFKKTILKRTLKITKRVKTCLKKDRRKKRENRGVNVGAENFKKEVFKTVRGQAECIYT